MAAVVLWVCVLLSVALGGVAESVGGGTETGSGGTLTAASPPSSWPPHPPYRLDFAPMVAAPSFSLVNTSSNGAGRLYSMALPAHQKQHEPRPYALGMPHLLHLSGTPHDIGHAYGQLLATALRDVYHDYEVLFPAEVLEVLDFLWECSLLPSTPAEFVAELEGIAEGARTAGDAHAAGTDTAGVDVGVCATRMVTIAALPSDAYNIEALLRRELERHGNHTAAPSDCAKRAAFMSDTLVSRAAVRLARAGKLGTGGGSSSAPSHDAAATTTPHPPGHCDFFAAWGSATSDGRLLASRNLDIHKDTGIARHKLVTVYNVTGRQPYATFGMGGFVGALAGMSAAGVTVSEANLDNGAVAFDGLAWPLHLRNLMGRATTLADVRRMWHANNNTAAFNFLVGSAHDAPPTAALLGSRGSAPPAAVAFEAISGYNGEFSGAPSPVEAAASYQCINATVMDGKPCDWPGNSDPLSIGHPEPDMVWRSNHALDPKVMASQEPLWDDTVMRYFLLHDRMSEAASKPGRMTVADALNITALLGIKGRDYGSCAPDNIKNPEASHVLSVVYDPSRHDVYVAWEDGHAESWRPAACNTYLHINFDRWFA
eukprot:m.48388 g.48388  ORF g.48388 m.48388 type:complete len:599 (+) comp11994_c0_seq2:66-1862(+)